MAENKGKLVAVIGATGNIGHVVVEQLLSQGVRVRAVGRSAAKLKGLQAKGAEVFEGSVEDQAAMEKAFAGASAAFLMLPPNYAAPDMRAAQNKAGEALAQAAAKAKVGFIVNLSSVGAQHDKGTGPILGVHDQELRLNQLGLAVEHLRPVFFMENHLNALGSIKAMGVYGGGAAPELAMAQIATRDIGAFAAERLASGGAKGATVTELCGPRDLTMAESAGILGAAIGKPGLKYQQFPYEGIQQALTGMGMSKDTAEKMVEMYKGFNAGLMKTTQPRSARTTGKTTLEEFAKTTFAKAYGQPAAAGQTH